ncbi:MAG: glycosyltransferase family 39 protein [Patescibacteria group bacterium]|jgi:uncharacterized membrane protein
MFNKKILLVFFFAFLIRLIALNQSLWLDEAVTANIVKNFSFLQIINKFSPTDFHPPLYYLFMKLWTNFFGYSEIALRMPSVLFSLMTGYFVYLVGGIWAAVFFLFNPLIVYYSQEARMYMMATFLLTSALYFFVQFCHPEFISGSRNKFGMTKVKGLVLMNLFLTLAFLTFYGSIFLIAPMLLYFLYKKNYKVFILNTLYFILITLLISPLLYKQLLFSKSGLIDVKNWSLVLGKANIKNLLLIPIKFSIGRISFYPKWMYWGIAGGWTGYVLYQILKIKNQNDKSKIKNIYLSYYLFIFPLILGFLVSFFIPMLQYFRFIYLIPIICLLLGFGLSGQSKYNLGGYVLAGGFLIFSMIYLLNPSFHREDWKGLVNNLPKDKPVYMIMASSDPVKYYSRSLKVKKLESIKESKEKEIVVIPYVTEIYGLDYKSLLSKNGYKIKKEVSFREVTYEQWIR